MEAKEHDAAISFAIELSGDAITITSNTRYKVALVYDTVLDAYVRAKVVSGSSL